MKTITNLFVALVLGLFLFQSAQAAVFITNSPMASARIYHSATLLANGCVLIVGGYDDSFQYGPVNSYLNSAELFNPAAESWTSAGTLPPLGGTYPNAHISHTATLLTNGLVMVAGGMDSANIFSSTELFNPASATWSFTGDMNIPRAYHTATLLTNGLVLVAGGMGCCSSTNSAMASAELYNPATGTWTNTGTMTASRKYHTATLLNDGRVLVAGGANKNGASLSSAELYNPVTGTWAATGTMTTAREYHTATLLTNGQVLVAGGGSGAELFDPATGKWSVTGSLNFSRSWHTATLLTNGQVLVVGGGSVTAELYNPNNRTWSASAALHTSRFGHTATMLTNGQVLITGGGPTPSFNVPNFASTEIYDFLLKASGTVTITNLNQIYDGTAKAVAVATSPTNLAVDLTYDGSSAAPTNVGSYNVIGIIDDPNYQGGATNILAINLPAINASLAPVVDGTFNLSFSNASGFGFSIYGTTNLSLPFTSWDFLGAATEVSPGQYQFIDQQATNNLQRFYIISSP
jgi:N-acetylneuraminic acid mutarotase